MAYRAPLRLLRDGQPFGTIVSYGYETPWATGELVADDPAAHARCDAVHAFRQWLDAQPDLPDAEDDARYERACAERGLTVATIAECTEADWALIDDEGTTHPAYSPMFIGDGFITWRW